MEAQQLVMYEYTLERITRKTQFSCAYTRMHVILWTTICVYVKLLTLDKCDICYIVDLYLHFAIIPRLTQYKIYKNVIPNTDDTNP